MADLQANASGTLTKRVVIEGVPYAVALTPLGFYGWRVASVIPKPPHNKLNQMRQTLS
ncbi:hypothetical protein [Ruegeria sp. Ofav3-42]|uniref:hypothetical protein n=1 Tax=Ruegeria sp. Ofav3-42 TaxID=2917759 RepID=UPI001EF5A105|nr:hypothetical protein [Ruegeria sp. Ofav3-42]MCG7521769.1 hypothetical protein [Ruegeria sp. Ofav3-42]